MTASPRTPAPRSAGVLVFRRRDGLEVLIGHMGGPFWARRMQGGWTVPKGEPEAGEDDLSAARREFREETGLPLPDGPLSALGEVRTSGGKTIVAWALEGDLDPGGFSPGTFTMPWPPRSGRVQEFPELDRLRWVGADEAAGLLTASQRPLLDRLRVLLRTGG